MQSRHPILQSSSWSRTVRDWAALMGLDTDMRLAIARGEFELYYQAIVDRHHMIAGLEGLVRWHHPRRGVIAPEAFIARAEKSALIIGLGDLVLQQACRQLAHWAHDSATAHLTLAVNVSAMQFRERSFVPRLLKLLEYSGANPHRLKLELTESVLLVDAKDTIERMTTLKSQGVRFSLDDFGTGYSSLSYLPWLPLDELKIDQSFVRDVLVNPRVAGVVQAIVRLAESVGLRVVAEGVENVQQLEHLREIGCHGFQGYYFSRPLPLAELPTMLRNVLSKHATAL